MAEAIRNALRWIKTHIFGGEESEVDAAIRMWNNAYTDAARNKNGTETKNTADGGVKWSLAYQNAEVNSEILALLEKVEAQNFEDNDFVNLGEVPQQLIARIKELTGVDVSGYRTVIEARMLKHILHYHGENGSTDHSMQDKSNIAKMQYVLSNPDDISYGGKTRAYTNFKNGYNRTAPTVLYEKSIGDKSFYVVQAVPETKKKTLYIVSAFIGNKGYKNRAGQLIDAKSPNVTTEFGSAQTPKNSVSYSAEKVKTIFGFTLDADAKVNEDLLEELSIHHPKAEVDRRGNITVYHRTSKTAAEEIMRTGIMHAKEDTLFFSSAKDGYASDYGDTIVALAIPSTKLRVNDIFDGEVHFEIPLQYKSNGFSMNVSSYLKNKSGVKNSVARDSETRITASDVEAIRSIGRKSINDFTSEDIRKSEKWARKFYQEIGTKSPFFRAWFGDWRAYDYNPIPISTVDKKSYSSASDGTAAIKEALKNKTAYRGKTKNKDTGFEITVSQRVYNDTLTYANIELSRSGNTDLYSARLSLLDGLPEICRNSVLLDTEVADANTPDRSFVHKFYAVVMINEEPKVVKLAVDEFNSRSGDIRRAYNLKNIEISPAMVSQVYKPASTASDNGEVISTISIADLYALVKQYDKEFSPKDVNSKLLNKDGTPRIVYHRTNADFTVFDVGRSGENQGKTHGDGIYLSTSKDAYSYAGDRVMDLYASIKNPFEMQLSKAEAERIYDTYFKPFHEDRFNTYRPHVIESLMSPLKVFDYLNEAAEKNHVKTSYILSQLGYDGVHDGIEWVAFDPTQVKSATDNIGTFDRGNSDTRNSLSVTDKLWSMGDAASKSTSDVLSALRELDGEARAAKQEFLPDAQTVDEIASSLAEMGLADGVTREDLGEAVQDAADALRALAETRKADTDVLARREVRDGYQVALDKYRENVRRGVSSKDNARMREKNFCTFIKSISIRDLICYNSDMQTARRAEIESAAKHAGQSNP